MPRLKVKNLKNEDVGEIDLNDAIFGAEVKEHLLHEIVRMQLNRRRIGSACTKERSAVSGGGKKPFKQKGTGRARQGSERSPNHVGGGVTFGPRPRSYDFSPPKKVRRGAMISALSLYAKENRLVVLDAFELEEIKTKSVNETLGLLEVKKALIVDWDQNDNLRYSTRNLASHRFTTPEGLNVLDILKHDQLVMTKRAVNSVEQRFERPVRERKVEA
jgi:large subunit ribosomal protein L4